MNRIVILNTRIDNLKRSDFFAILDGYLSDSRPRHIATVNAEFLVTALGDLDFRDVLRSTSLNLADGIGVLWGARFFATPLLSVPGLRILQAILSCLATAILTLLYPPYGRTIIKEKISGSDLVFEIASRLEKSKSSLFLLGGYGDTSQKVRQRLLDHYPTLRISGCYAGSPDDPQSLLQVQAAKPDILLVAYGPVRQEKWIAENLQKLPIKAAIGVGGAFDYIAGIRPAPPQILRHVGLEWAWRAVTQPHRLKRIFTAVVVYPWLCIKYRAQLLKPYRKNAVACVVNQRNQILVCRRKLTQYQDLRLLSLSGEVVWQLPQGGLEPHESFDAGMRRELIEETGLHRLRHLGTLPQIHRYDWPPEFAYASYGGQYRGQEQSIVFYRLSGPDKIVLDQHEFDSYQWIDKDSLLSIIHPVRHGLVKLVYENFDKFVTMKI